MATTTATSSSSTTTSTTAPQGTLGSESTGLRASGLLRLSRTATSVVSPSSLGADIDSNPLFGLTAAYVPEDVDSIMQHIANHYEYTLAGSRINLSNNSMFRACSFALRDRLIETWNDTQRLFRDNEVKRAYYISIEFLMGRAMQNALINRALHGPFNEAIHRFGMELEGVEDEEHDPGLGSGGLGRLAACFLDSLATLNYPSWGYGIRYKYGQFEQNIIHKQQVETPDFWLEQGNPWEVCRTDIQYEIGFGGHVAITTDEKGDIKFEWVPANQVGAIAYDIPIPGYGTKNTLTLRLWSSKPVTHYKLEELALRHVDPWEQLKEKQIDEELSCVLYPKTDTLHGRELRLKQQFFLCCASIQDIMRRHRRSKATLEQFAEKTAIQLNDTHPTISIPELMRQFLDIYRLNWDTAWDIVTKTFSFTNHTVLPEALERWPVPMIEWLLPRHMQIIFEINHRFLQQVTATFNPANDIISHLSIIEEGSPKTVRMANLALVSSHIVNGVARIHTDILKSSLFGEWNRLWPGKIINITNGVTPRRWILCCNRPLSELISSCLGTKDWATNLELLAKLKEPENVNPKVLQALEDCKIHAKTVLANLVLKRTNGTVTLTPTALFDIQVKRIHEYKRQLLNILGIIHRYHTIKMMTPKERENVVPRVQIFAGKAAAGYERAKVVIMLINNVAEVINNDPDVGNLLKVVFISNYSVSLAEKIIPAADISEHISTAGTEASGTSNMKFAMNGGLILGTMDGANVEIGESIGFENMYIFGARTDQVQGIRSRPPSAIDYRLYGVLRSLENGEFGPYPLYKPLMDPLWGGNDYYLLGHDFPQYVAMQNLVDTEFLNRELWNKKCLFTIAGMGRFSSDNSIEQYATQVWGLTKWKLDFPQPVTKGVLKTSKS
ncbi:glycogen phosphorylase [Pelomyxa schiedti]|nr:glycogen phosphorylase [Pelomyxa schiedti]